MYDCTTTQEGTHDTMSHRLTEEQRAERRQWHALDQRILRAKAKASPERRKRALRAGFQAEIVCMMAMYDAEIMRDLGRDMHARLIAHIRHVRRELMLRILKGDADFDGAFDAADSYDAWPVRAPTSPAAPPNSRRHVIALAEAQDAVDTGGMFRWSSLDQRQRRCRAWQALLAPRVTDADGAVHDIGNQ